MPEVVEKPWGREIWFAHEREYAGKILEVNEGERLSLQYHEKKKETMYVLSGEMKLTLDGEERVLREGDSVTINPGQKHRIEAVTPVRIAEVSTPQLDDVVRIEDDYERA